MTTAWKPLVVVGCLLLSGTATGCTTQSNASPTTPQPSAPTSPSPSEREADRVERERFEAATKAYEKGERVAYKMAIDGGATKKVATKKLKPYMSGEYLDAYVEILVFMKKEKLRIEDYPTTQTYPTGGDTNRQMLTACMDVSKARTLDRNDKNVDPPENQVQILKVDMRFKGGAWKGIEADGTYFESFENTICEK